MLRALVVLIVGGTLLSSVLTPPVFSLLQSWLGEVPWPYSRVFDRVALVVACGLVYLLRRQLGLASLRPYYRDWRRRGDVRRLVLGLLLTASIATLTLPLLASSGVLVPDAEHATGGLILRSLTFLPAALLIATLEESFFRVLVFERLRGSLPTVLAALVASLFYAVLHFVSPDRGASSTRAGRPAWASSISRPWARTSCSRVSARGSWVCS